MANFKFVKSATAAVLGASVLTTAVVVPGADASAKTTYKVNKNGTLVNAKTNKAVKGYKTYKGKLYKNGKKFTGKTSSGVYYVKGKKFTGKTKYGYYYVNGKRFTGTTKYGYYYVNGKRFNGKTKYGNLYVDGKRYTGTTKYGYTYYNGKRVEGEYKAKVYTNGKLVTGLYKEKLYNKGVLETGLDLYKDKLYKDGVLNVGYALYNEDLYKDAAKNEGFVADPLKDGKAYNDTKLANGTFDVDGVEKAYEDGVEVGAKVKSVEAINAIEVKVTFNKTVSKDSLATTDFTVTETASPSTTVTVSDVQLSEDGKSATLLLASAVPATGVDVSIAEGAILTKDFDKFAKSTTTEVRAAKDTTAPKLLSAVADGANIELTFDEPVNFGSSYTGAKIDQTAAATQPVNSTKAGKYVYTIAASSALADGKHTVDLTNVTDFAGNTDVLVSTDVTVKSDTSAASVASITAEDSTSFIVKFNKAVKAPTASNFVLKKGNLTLDATNFTVAPTLVDEDGNAVAAGTTSSKYVKVSITDLNTSNPLYGTDENSVALSVKLSGYTDASGVLGTDYTNSVTLSKDLTAPAIKSEKLITSTATTIVLPFTKTVTSTTANTVTVKQGNVLVAQSAAVSTPTADNNLTLTFAANVLEPGKTYTITLAKGAAVSGTQSSEATTITYTVPTTAVSYTTTAPTVAASKSNGKNVLTLTYADEVNDAAALASSYKLNGANLPTGTDIYFADADKNKVIIELPTSYSVDTENKAVKFTVNASTVKYADDATTTAVAGKYVSGSANTATAAEQAITLKDNVAPTISKVEYVKNSSGLATGLKVTLSEAVTDSTLNSTFVIKQGSTVISYAKDTTVTSDVDNDNVLYLAFNDGASTPAALTVTASNVTLSTSTTAANITLADANGNVIGALASAIAAQ